MFKRFFSRSTPTSVQPTSKTLNAKQKELQEAELALLAACSGVEYATAIKSYQETRIARLKELIRVERDHLASLEAVNEVIPAPTIPQAHAFSADRLLNGVRVVHPFKTPEVMARKVPG